MATVIPPAFPADRNADRRFDGEALVYRELARALPEPWLVVYSLAWAGHDGRHPNPVHGEADFVIVHPTRGFVVLEVKGGRIRTDERGRWISVNRDGQPAAVEPFEQTRRNVFALREKLAQLEGWQTVAVPAIEAVALPDVPYDKPPVGAAYTADMVIVRSEFDRFEARLDALLPPPAGKFPESLAKAMKRILHPVWAPRETLGGQILRDRERFAALGDDQLEVLEGFAVNPRMAVSGVPGSGKTALALHMALRLAREGKRTLLTCYNKKLARHLRENAGDAPGLVVSHFHELCFEFATTAGCPPAFAGAPTNDDFDRKFPPALEEAVTVKPELRFDAVVVDEGQDFAADWWIALEAATTAGDRAPLYVFYDPQQSIFEAHPELPPGLVPFHLAANRRNTKAIAAFVDDMLGTRSIAKGPDGRPVEFIHAADAVDTKVALGALLRRLVDVEHVAPRDIVVLSPRYQRSQVREAVCGGFRLIEGGAEPKDIAFGSIHGYKGLERPVVVLVELDDPRTFTGAKSRRLVGVGASRATSHLVVIGRTP